MIGRALQIVVVVAVAVFDTVDHIERTADIVVVAAVFVVEAAVIWW